MCVREYEHAGCHDRYCPQGKTMNDWPKCLHVFLTRTFSSRCATAAVIASRRLLAGSHIVIHRLAETFT